MVDLNLNVLLVQAISFLITLALLKKLAWAPVMGMLASRETEIRSNYEQADAERRKTEDVRRQYEDRLKGAEAEARSRINEALDRAQEQAVQVTGRAQEEAQAITQRARDEMERERKKVEAELRATVGHLSVAIAGKIIDEHLDENKHRALIDDTIDRLGTLS